jgi:hypothetical protein
MKKHVIETLLNLHADKHEDIMLLQLLLRHIPVAPTTRLCLLSLLHLIIAHSAASVCVNKSKSLHFPISDLHTDYHPYESRHSAS